MESGAQPGNKNATRNKHWTAAINKALKQYNKGDHKAGFALDHIAERLVEMACFGSTDDFLKSLGIIGDRIEGKPVAALEIELDDKREIIINKHMTPELVDIPLDKYIAYMNDLHETTPDS